MATLTICLPTRNRQAYCIETIRAIADSASRDFEVVVADNSDDGSVLAAFFVGFADPRFRLIAPEGRVLSMVDNWERTMAAAQGRWIAFIGDDDYCDPRVAELIRRYERMFPDVEAVGWNRMNFNWPDNRPRPTLATIPLSFDTYVAKKSLLADRLFRWSEGKRRPSAGFGAYHGAVKRSLMDRIRKKFGGRYFEHPMVDYESSCKVIAEAKTLVHCQRPFSVLGACAASNSAGALSRKTMMERAKIFEEETKDNIALDRSDFPFTLVDQGSSICVGVAATTWWFCRTYGIDLTGFPENFAKAAIHECMSSPDIEEYEVKVAGFRRGFAAWDGGRWKDLFAPPPFAGNRILNETSGVLNDIMYLAEAKVPARTPYEFYRFGEHAIIAVDHLVAGTRTFAR
jgi:Glycosyltransferases involved in cell wall biogenesis